MIWRNPLLRELPKALTTTLLRETFSNTRGNDLGHSKNVKDKINNGVLIKMDNPQVCP
jgi:hypothetical protein